MENRIRKIISPILFLIKWIFLLIMVIFTLFPVVYVMLGAFKTNVELTTGGTILPRTWTFSNFPEAWEAANFAGYTWNSVYFCIFVTLGALLISSSAGYIFARKEFIGKKFLHSLLLSTMFITLGAVIYRPLFLMMVRLGLSKTLWGVILIQIGSQSTNTFLVEKFVKGLSVEMEDAARVDGCSTFRIYWNIILPLIRPILGVVALFSFRDAWNSYVLPSIFTMGNQKLMTLTVGIVNLKYTGSNAIQWNIMLAGSAIAIIPMIVIFIISNKQFISGLTAGSVKA